MKKTVLITIFMLLTACFCAGAEPAPTAEPGVTAAYLDISLTLPADWQEYPLTEEQTAAGIGACYGNGSLLLTISAEERSRDIPDAAAYMASLSVPGAFIESFGGYEFVLYNDLENSSAVCAVPATDLLMYTFVFSPVTGAEEDALTILGIMETFSVNTAPEAKY